MRQYKIGAGAVILCGIVATAARGQATAPAVAPAAERSATATVPADAAPAAPARAAPAKSYLSLDPFSAGAGGELLLFQDMPVVVSASKREQPQNQVPASVSVITASDIELFGYRSLADVLRNQRGFYLHTDGLNWFAGERGFLRPGEWNARMMVLVDGRPTRETTYGQTHLDLDFVVPMEAVQRVEVVRAPGSGLYGGNAVFSVTNVITKTGADINGVQVKLQGGMQETARASLLFGKAFPDDWDVVAGITGYTSQGDKDIRYDGVTDAAHNFGHIRNADVEQVESGFLKIRHGELTLEADIASRLKGSRTARYQDSWFDPGYMREDRANVALRLDHDLENGQSLHMMAYYGRYRYHQKEMYDDDGSGQSYWYTSNAESDWVGAEIYYDWQATDRCHLLLGADAVQGLRNQQEDHDSVSGSLLKVNPSFNTWGLFAQGDYKVADWLSVSGGIRLNDTQRSGKDVGPRLAIILTPTRADTVKLLYGRAFRTPNLYEMFYSLPDANTPNPNLKSEISDTYELAWERQDESGWRMSIGPYFWNMSRALDDRTLPDDSLQTQNIGSQRAYGFEAEIERRWENGARVRAYGAVTRAEHDGETLTLSPAWILGAAVAIPIINERTFLAIEPQIVGPQKSDLGRYTSPTFITNVVLTSKDVTQGLDLQLGVYNIFGEWARLPHSSSWDYYQPTLNYPTTQFIFSMTGRF
jgi:outer membrane receptor for ferrienterochelin and colicins